MTLLTPDEVDADKALRAQTPGQGQSCRHCAGPLLATTVSDEGGGVFCCQGCLEVHRILGGKGWDQFYDLLRQSGGQVPRVQASRDYDAFLSALRTPQGLQGIGRQDGDDHTVSLACRDINCAACGFLIENILRDHPAVSAFEVDFIHGEMTLTYQTAKAHLADILSTVARFGFRFRPRDASASGEAARNHGLWRRMAVSGASFANAMAFSLTNYFGLLQGVDSFWSHAFGWFALLAALPAAFYGGTWFFQGAWRAIRARVFSLDLTITLGIALTFTVSLDAMMRGRPEASYADSLAGLVFFLLVGRWAVGRFESSLVLRSRWFDGLKPATLWVFRNGDFESLPSESVMAGDRVRLLPGSYAPCDGILLSPQAIVEMSVLTGESRAKSLQRGDALFAGSRIEAEAVEITVSATPGQSRVTGLLNSLSQLQSRREAAPRTRERVALGFTLVVITAALAALVVHAHEGWHAAFLIAASVFIVSCSCALALALPISRGLGLKRAFALGFHFRSQSTLERLVETKVVLFDKTGTLSYSQRKCVGWQWLPAAGDSSRQAQLARHCLALCRHSRHPVAISLAEGLADGEMVYGQEAGLEKKAKSSQTKASSLPIVQAIREVTHLGLFGNFEQDVASMAVMRYGAWKDDPAVFRDLDWSIPGEEAEAFLAASSQLPSSAIFANGHLVAVAMLREEIRPEVPQLVKQLTERGFYTALLSGDNPERVADFAHQCGFQHFAGGLTPEEKQAEAAKLKRSHGFTLALGDGFNDSLLLGEADISLAVSGDLPMVAEGADILFTGESPAALLRLLDIAQGVQASMRAGYIVSGLYNAMAISGAFLGWVSPLFAAVLMPISSLSLGLTAFLAIPSVSDRK